MSVLNGAQRAPDRSRSRVLAATFVLVALLGLGNAITQPEAASAATGKTVRVASIPALLANLANNSVSVIVVANGTYHISPANWTSSNSLWIGAKFASRTRAILVKAETRGHVVFDGGGGSGYSALSFEAGAHDQTWDGFVFANMRAVQSGIVEIGGYVPRAAPHNITLHFIWVRASCRGLATSPSGPMTEHAFYFANAKGVGPNHILLSDIYVDGRGGLASAVQFDHGDSANPNASFVTVQRLHVTGTQQAILFWTPTVHNITFHLAVIWNAGEHAVRFESRGAKAVVILSVASHGSGREPFYSSMGSHPPGLALSHTVLR
ncbi:MAG TPA: hypothetical protein VF323_04875 [Candidatus Limnocylindrales bacterium]